MDPMLAGGLHPPDAGRGLVEEFVQEGPGVLLQGLPVSGIEVLDLPLQLLVGDLLEPPPEGPDHRHHLQGLVPGQEPVHLLDDDPLHLGNLFPAPGPVLVGDALQGIQVVEEEPSRSPTFGMDVPGIGDIHHDLRALESIASGPGTSSVASMMGSRAPVAVTITLASTRAPSISSQGRARPPNSSASSWARSKVRFTTVRTFGLGIGEMPGHQSPRLPGPDDQDRIPLQPIQDLLGHLHGGVGHGYRAPPDLGLGSGPFPHMHGRVEETGEQGPRRPGADRRPRRPPGPAPGSGTHPTMRESMPAATRNRCRTVSRPAQE